MFRKKRYEREAKEDKMLAEKMRNGKTDLLAELHSRMYNYRGLADTHEVTDRTENHGRIDIEIHGIADPEGLAFIRDLWDSQCNGSAYFKHSDYALQLEFFPPKLRVKEILISYYDRDKRFHVRNMIYKPEYGSFVLDVFPHATVVAPPGTIVRDNVFEEQDWYITVEPDESEIKMLNRFCKHVLENSAYEPSSTRFIINVYDY